MEFAHSNIPLGIVLVMLISYGFIFAIRTHHHYEMLHSRYLTMLNIFNENRNGNFMIKCALNGNTMIMDSKNVKNFKFD